MGILIKHFLLYNVTNVCRQEMEREEYIWWMKLLQAMWGLKTTTWDLKRYQGLDDGGSARWVDCELLVVVGKKNPR